MENTKSKWMHWKNLTDLPHEENSRLWFFHEDKSQCVVFQGDKVVRIFEDDKVVYSYDAEAKPK